MPDITELTKAGLTGWPLAFAIGICAICIASFFNGWPWPDIIIHKHWHNHNDSDDWENENEK